MPTKKSPFRFTSTHVVLIIFISAVLLTTYRFVFYKNHKSKSTKATQVYSTVTATPEKQLNVFDFGNQTMDLMDQQVRFVNGVYNSSNQKQGVRTAKVSQPTLNPSGTTAAVIVTDNPGGSGTFFYLVGALRKEGETIYSQPVLLGDRIKIVSLSLDNPGTEDNGLLSVEYLDRSATAAMSEEPSVKVIKKFAFQDNGGLIGVMH